MCIKLYLPAFCLIFVLSMQYARLWLTRYVSRYHHQCACVTHRPSSNPPSLPSVPALQRVNLPASQHSTVPCHPYKSIKDTPSSPPQHPHKDSPPPPPPTHSYSPIHSHSLPLNPECQLYGFRSPSSPRFFLSLASTLPFNTSTFFLSHALFFSGSRLAVSRSCLARSLLCLRVQV